MPPVTATPPPPAPAATASPPRRFDNGAEWIASLGGIPLERVIFDPWPGTATEADLLRLVERDKRLCELVNGTLLEKPVGYWESRLAMIVARHLANFAEADDLGAVSGADSTLRMKHGRVRLPDVAFIVKARIPRTREAIPLLAPDLAVEVLSPSNTQAEMRQKITEYFESGTRLAWLVDPASRTVAVHTGPGEPGRVLTEADTLDGGDVLPGFSLPVADLFRDLPAE